MAKKASQTSRTASRPTPEPESVLRLLIALDAALVAADDVRRDLRRHVCQQPADDCSLCEMFRHAEGAAYILHQISGPIGAVSTPRRSP